MSDEEFNLNANLNFIVRGLEDALGRLKSAEGRVDELTTAISKMEGTTTAASRELSGFENASNNATKAIAKARQGLESAATAAKQESTAVSEGSKKWQERVAALNKASDAYRAFRRNQLTGQKEGDTYVNPYTQTGSEQSEYLKTRAAQTANYGKVISQASDQIAAAQKRINAVDAATNYDRKVKELGTLGAAQQRAAQAQTRLSRLETLNATINRGDPSLLRQATMQTAIAGAKEENRAATKALIAEQTRLRESDQQAAQAQKKLDAELAAAKQELASTTKSGRYDLEAQAYGRVTAAENRQKEATRNLSAAERELRTVRASSDAGTRKEVAAIKAVTAARKEAAAANKEVLASRGVTNEAPIPTIFSGIKSGPLSALSRLDERQLPRLRYATYDLSYAFGILGGAMTGAFVGTEAAMASYQSEFAQVRRTTSLAGQEAADFEKQLVSMSQSMPTSFSDLAGIATLGGQLNIAKSELAGFTKATAEFSATTNVSVDQSGTALGRLNQLLPDVNGNFQALGSSILKVGVNSVATESQIIQTAQGLAGIASTVGLTTSQVIGLSGALASLGIQPELARSTMTRLFIQLQEAIETDSSKLKQFAALAGMTGAQFKKAFKADAGSALVQMFKGINAQGDKAIATLQGLGLTSIRDIPSLLKLAQNTDVLQSALKNASTGFNDASEMNKQYARATDTLSAKLKELGNTFLGMMNAMASGTGGPLEFLVTVFANILKGATALIDTPLGKWVGGITLALSGLLGVGALLLAVMARGTASTLAFATFRAEYAQALEKQRISADAARQAETELSGAEAEGAAATQARTAATEELTAAEQGALKTGKALKALKWASWIGLGVTAISLAVTAWQAYDKAQKDALKTQKHLFSNSTDTMASALAKDQEAYKKSGDAITLLTTKITTNSRTADEWVKPLESASGAQVELSDKTSKATKKINDQTIAFGKNAQKALASTLANSDAIQKLMKPTKANKAAEGLGADPLAFVKAALGGPQAAQKYVDNLYNSIARRAGIDAKKLKAHLDLFKGFAQTGPADFAKRGQFADTIDKIFGKTIDPKLIYQIGEATSALQGYGSAATSVGTLVQGAANKQAVASLVMQQYSDSAKQAGGAAGLFGQDLVDAVDKYMSAGVATQQFIGNLGSLGQSFIQNGVKATISGSVMEEVLEGIAQSSASGPQAAARMSVLFSAIVQGGYASAAALNPLIKKMAALTGAEIHISKSGGHTAQMLKALRSASVGSGGGGAAGGLGKVGSAAGKAAKKVRTLADYAQDLSTVFDRTAEIKFGPQKALDAITQAWDDMATNAADAKSKVKDATQAIKDAQQKAKEANATIAGLNAKDNADEYWLKVAKMYGDAAKVKSIKADMQQNAADRSSAESDLSGARSDEKSGRSDLRKANAGASTELRGNTEAAIKNRTALTGLVDKYHDLIAAYASSGMPADKLKQKVAQLRLQFIKQGTSMGFSRKELSKYSSSFKDMAVVVSKIPRNVTINTNLSAVNEALAEFMAKKKAAEASSGGGGGGGGGVGGGGFGVPDYSDLYGGAGKSKGPKTITMTIDGDTGPIDRQLGILMSRIDSSTGMVNINGTDRQASNALDDILYAINHGKGTIQINGKTVDTQKALYMVVDQINKSVGTIDINGNKVPAGEALLSALQDINKSSATLTIDGNRVPASTALRKALNAISRGHEYVKIDGKKKNAMDVLQQALAAIRASKAAVQINADMDMQSGHVLGELFAGKIHSGITGYFRGNPIRAFISTNGVGHRVDGTQLNFYDTGGWTGPGAKLDVAGLVHRDEYVFPKKAVHYYGVENLAYMHQRAVRGYANGGPVGRSMPSMAFAAANQNGSVLVGLDASSRDFFVEEVAERIASRLTITDGAIAVAGANANSRLNRVGAR